VQAALPSLQRQFEVGNDLRSEEDGERMSEESTVEQGSRAAGEQATFAGADPFVGLRILTL